MRAEQAILPHMDKAALVFTDTCRHWMSRVLKPGYRHVFAVVPSPHDDGTSIIVDFTMQGVTITPVDGTAEQVADHYNNAGLEAVLVPYRPWERTYLTMVLNNCVGHVKQTVGITSWARTPWQLRCHVLKEEIEADEARA